MQCSVVDRHPFDAYPDPTFPFDTHRDLDPDRNPDPCPSFFTCWKIRFTALSVYITVFNLFSQVHGFHDFLELSGKKLCLALHLVEVDTLKLLSKDQHIFYCVFFVQVPVGSGWG